MEHLLPGSPVVFILAWFGWRIANKAGFNGYWGLLALFPPAGLVALWILAARRDWPRDDPSSPRAGGKPGPARRNHDAVHPHPPARRDPSDITIRRPGGPVTRTD